MSYEIVIMSFVGAIALGTFFMFGVLVGVFMARRSQQISPPPLLPSKIRDMLSPSVIDRDDDPDDYLPEETRREPDEGGVL